MNPNNYAQNLLKTQGKVEAKRIAESALKLAQDDGFWVQVNNILKKIK